MNIQPVTLRPGQVLHVNCRGCGLPFAGERAPGSYKNRTDRTILADLDGPAFEAYYHWQCIPTDTPE